MTVDADKSSKDCLYTNLSELINFYSPEIII